MNTDRALFHPDYKPEPYWWEAARPGTQFSTDLPADTEIFVVGSGYSGLSAALELARAGRAVTVVDAQAFGEAASSRSGGGVSGGVNLGKGISGGPGQDAQAEALLTESAAAYDHVIALIEKEGIDCNLEQRGRFIGANAPKHLPGLVKKAEMLNRVLGVGATVVAKEDQRSEIGSDFYHGGVAIERAAKLHPALYYKGLLETCHAAGVSLTAHCEVTAIDGKVGGFKVQTAKGECRAEQVIVATNGYTGGLTPDLRKRLVPISSQIIVTEELPQDLADELIPKGRTISESARITSYYRLTPGNRRVMYGGRARFHHVDADVSAGLLHGMMTARWPQLKDARITHSWSGFVAMTTDSLPHIGLEKGMHYAAGCNGSGVAMMTYLGHQVARRILQDGKSDSGFANIDFPPVPVPLYNGNPWFLPIIGGYYRLRDKWERGNG
jgi:glycine/D-amino acid oxidase-like deaminating enzyme